MNEVIVEYMFWYSRINSFFWLRKKNDWKICRRFMFVDSERKPDLYFITLLWFSRERMYFKFSLPINLNYPLLNL
jgi:hypothetical protein